MPKSRELGDRDARHRAVEDVIRLDVAVDDALVVRVVQRVEQVDADVVFARVREFELPLLLGSGGATAR